MPFCSPEKINIPDDRFRTANDHEVFDMAESIKLCGQLQPILVTKRMELVDGLHRLLACKKIQKDVWWVDEEEGKLLLEDPRLRRIAEFQANFRRREFTPFEQAKAIAELDDSMRELYGSRKAGKGLQEGWTQKDTAKKLGYKSHRRVSEALLIAKAAKDDNIPGLENAKTFIELVKMVNRGGLRTEKPTSHKTWLSIGKKTYLYHQGMKYDLKLFNNENTFEKFIYENSKLFLGENNYYIDAKHKIQTKGFNAIPDGFLLDVTDENNPILYIVEIEISTHDFNHISAHVMKYNNLILKSKKEIIEIVSAYIPQEVKLLLQKSASQINYGILIIIDKEDSKIEPLIECAPKDFTNYKIISIESYKKSESNDIIFVKSDFFKEKQITTINYDEFE